MQGLRFGEGGEGGRMGRLKGEREGVLVGFGFGLGEGGKGRRGETYVLRSSWVVVVER